MKLNRYKIKRKIKKKRHKNSQAEVDEAAIKGHQFEVCQFTSGIK